MPLLRRWLWLALCAVLLPAAAKAARISEPGTTLFGLISESVGGQFYPIRSGNLEWRIRTAGPGGREHTFRTRLAPFGTSTNPLSYRLTLPHELLAHDLRVRSNAVAIAALSSSVHHLSVTLDGKPLVINPLVASGFQIAQPDRAGTRRIDLTLVVAGPDSDGDGFADSWEDANGFDKWDPASNPTGGSGTNGGNQNSVAVLTAQARTFGEWRSILFPGQTGSLDLFGEADDDADGISNLFEYAFDLDPRAPDQPDVVRLSLPHTYSKDGRQGLGFRRRSQAVDLSFQIEHAPDLFLWSNAFEALEPATSSVPGDPRTLLVEKQAAADDTSRFFRVVVRRQ